MKTFVNCPRCGDEIEFNISSDYQGEGVWGQVVEFSEMTEKKCDCDLSMEELSDLEEKASEKAADYDPANDIDFDSIY